MTNTSVNNRTIVLTGASDGVGLAAVKDLVDHGHTIIAVGRNEKKIAEAEQRFGDAVTWLRADFADFGQVRRLAEEIKKRTDHIDVLVNNAGAAMPEYTTTVDGNELTVQVNHLSPYLLTNLLIDELAAGDGIVVCTASIAAVWAKKPVFPGLARTRETWSQLGEYGDTKLFNILFAKELSRRFADRGIFACSYHPGVVASGFGLNLPGVTGFVYRTFGFFRPVFDTPEKAATRLVPLVEGQVGKDFVPGVFLKDGKPKVINPLAEDEDLAVRLWEESQRLTGMNVS